MTVSARGRFWSRVTTSRTSDECWPWTGNLSHNGYGRFSFVGWDGKTHKIRAHRAALELHRGATIPAGETVDHTCRNRICCNPDHLEVVGHGENTRRRFADDATARYVGRLEAAVTALAALCAEHPAEAWAARVTAILDEV